MLLARPQPLRLRPLRHLGRRREVRSLTAATIARGRLGRTGPVAALAAARPIAARSVTRWPIAAASGCTRSSRRSPPSRRRPRRSSGPPSRRGRRGPSSRRPGTRCWITGSKFSSAGSSWSSRSERPSPSPAPPTRRGCRRCPSPSRPGTGRRRWHWAGGSEPSRTPRGSRAPAARQVHEPSGAELVSSISMRMDMARHRTGSAQIHSSDDRAGGAPCGGGAAGSGGYRSPMPIYALGDQVPDIDASAYVHPDAVVIGSVRIGPRELGVAQRRASRRRRGDPHRCPHEHPGRQRRCTRRSTIRRWSATSA